MLKVSASIFQRGKGAASDHKPTRCIKQNNWTLLYKTMHNIICLRCTGMKLRTNWKMICYIILHGIHFKAPNINYFPLFQNIWDSEFSESEFSFKIQHHELANCFFFPFQYLGCFKFGPFSIKLSINLSKIGNRV